MDDRAGHDSAPDSVSLDAFSGAPDGRGAPKKRAQLGGIKELFLLFLLFLFVVSDVFTNSVISGFGEKAVKCRSPTSWGTALQGVFLVIGFIVVIHLSENQII